MERDRFWDHELDGPVVTSADQIGREKCAQLCSEYTSVSAVVADNGRPKRETKEDETLAEGNSDSRGNDVRGLFTTESWTTHGPRRNKRPAKVK